MKAWKLVSLLLAIALIVAVVFCVTLNNSQKLASDEFAKVQADLDAAQATIAEKEQALTDADTQSKAALDQATADKETAVTQAASDKDAAVAAAAKEWEGKLKAAEDKAAADLEAALTQAAADKDAAVAAAVKDDEAKLAEAVQAKAELQLTVDEKDKQLVDAQATIATLQEQIAALTPTPSPTPEPTPTPAPTATVAP